MIKPVAIGLALLAIPVVSSASPLQLDGIPVRGNVRSVSAADVRDAIKTVHWEKVSKVTVVNADRIHVFLKPADRGWIAVERLRFATDPTQPKWSVDGRGVDDAEVAQFMRNADEVYVFPVLTPSQPHRDDKRMRRLDNQARRVLVPLLSDHRNWYHGGYTLISAAPAPRNIGVLLRRNGTELVLFFSPSFTSSAGLIEGTFNGQNIGNMLEDAPGKKMEQWSHQFAQPELSPTKKSKL